MNNSRIISFKESDIVWEEFKNPPKSARPMVRWWWPGLDVEKEELVNEVKELDEAGFYGAEIQSFMIGCPIGLEKTDRDRAERSHRFMQPYYFKMVKALLDEAEKRDMIIDITENSAWPAGGTDISKDLSMKVLMLGQKVIKGGRRYKGKVPLYKKLLFWRMGGPLSRFLDRIIPNSGDLLRRTIFSMEYLDDDMELLALIAAKPIGKPGKVHLFKKKTHLIDRNSIIDLTDKVKDKILEWNVPEGKWQIFAFYKGPSGAQPLFDARMNVDDLSLVMDHFSSKPILHHLEEHFGEGKKYFGEHYGKTFRAFFTDSLELSSDWHWTDGFLERFKELRGYDLKPYLPIVYIPRRYNKYILPILGVGVPCFDFEGEDGERIRYDYEKTLSDLFCEEYVKIMADWAEKNDILSRIQAYGFTADTLRAWGLSHIPETEQLYAGGTLDFFKFAGSAGLIYEKPIVTAESHIYMGRDYMTTPLKWKVAADKLLVSGINQMIYHGFPYQNPLFPYPGFMYSTPYISNQMKFSTNFSRTNPFWEFFPIMNGYMTRCQYVLQRGKTECQIGIYFPILNYCDSSLKKEELHGGILDDQDCTTPTSKFIGKIKEKGLDEYEIWTKHQLDLADKLMDNGYSYVHINEESIINAKIEENKLKIGICELRVLILHNTEAISVELTERIKEITEAGIPVLFLIKIPHKQPGFLNQEENNKKINTIFKNEIQDKIHFLDNEVDPIKYINEILKISPQISFENEQPTVKYIHKKTKNSDIFLLRHSDKNPLDLKVRFNNIEKFPYMLNPWNGDIQQAAQYKIENNCIIMNLHFEGYGSFIIEFKDGEELPHLEDTPIKLERTKNGSLHGLLHEIGTYDFKLKDGSKKSVSIVKNELAKPIQLKDWTFHTDFREYTGEITPIDLTMKENKDWRKIKQLKYSSSRGIYATSFILESEHIKQDTRLILSLGRVGDVAVVKVNGSEFDPIMVYPFEVDITEQVAKGQNKIEIHVIPTLKNRLVGYAKKGGKDWRNHKKKVLMPSGLLEPVIIYQKKEVVL